METAATKQVINLIRRDQVLARTGLGRSTLYKLMGLGVFPHPVRITGKAVAWKSDQVEAWIDSRESTSV